MRWCPRNSDRPGCCSTLLLDASDLPAAIIEYELAVEQDATRAEPHMYIALYLNGGIEVALHELRAAVLLDPELWPAAFYLAVCNEALGQLERHASTAMSYESRRARAGRAGRGATALGTSTAWSWPASGRARRRRPDRRPCKNRAFGVHATALVFARNSTASARPCPKLGLLA